MSIPAGHQSLRPALRATADMIKAAFPDGVPESAYRSLLALLAEGMSFRGLAEVVSYCTGRPYAVAYNDVLAAASSGSGPADEKVRQVLNEHGYQQWLMSAE